jgi:hypothetical protein
MSHNLYTITENDKPVMAVCDVCGKPAVFGCYDIQRMPDNLIGYARYKQVGKPHLGCADHGVKSIEYDERGVPL